MKNIKLISGIIIGALISIAGVAFAVQNVGVPSSTGYGVIPVGKADGTYQLMATSTLGISGGTGGGGSGTVGTSTSETTGYVPFWSTTSQTPALLSSNSNFFWDNTGKKLGIGTTSPSSRLSVWGSDTSANTAMFELTNSASTTLAKMQDDGTFYLKGNVGIGTTSPGQKLSVAGDVLGNNIIGSYFTATTTASSTLPRIESSIGNFSGSLCLGGVCQSSWSLVGTGDFLTSSFGTYFYNFFHATTTDALPEGSTNKYDKTVTLTGAGTVTTSGTYPNFTITGTSGSGTGWASTTDPTSIYFTGTKNVGVGTTTPYSKLSVWGTDTLVTTSMFELTNSASTTLAKMQDDGTFYMKGNVGIGTTSPGQKLSVAGDILGNRIIGSYFTATSSTASSTFQNVSVNQLAIGSLSGVLKAVGGFVTSGTVNLASEVAGILGISNGGTGTSTAPSYGKILVGNSNSSYDYYATSTLGLVTSLGAQYSNQQFGSTQTFATSSDLNLGLTITSSGNTHTFTPTWSGTLADNRIASSNNWNTAFNRGYPFTFSQNFGVTMAATSTPIWAQNGIYASSTSQFASASTSLLTVLNTAYFPGSGIWNSSGNLGIGTTSPGQKLSVAGDILGNNIIGSYFTATSMTASSTIPWLSSTIGNFGTLCIGGGCHTSWPTGGSGLTSLNGQTGATQTFATSSTASTKFSITSSGNVHTLNIPPASATANGLVTTGAQTFAGDKTFSNVITTGQIGGPTSFIISTGFGFGSTNGGIYFRPDGGSSGAGGVTFLATGVHKFNNSVGTTQVIFDNGNVGIGTSTPATTLDVNGTITQLTVKSCSLGLTTNALGSITGCVASDQSLKKNISPIVESMDTLLKLTPVNYEWKDSSRGTGMKAGFIAQGVEKVFPAAVVSSSPTLKAVDPNAILSLVVHSFQDFYKQYISKENTQDAQIKELKNKIDAQQKQIDTLIKLTHK